MAKFTKPFKGVPKGEIYPKEYAVGDECPAELEDGARSLKALEKTASKAMKTDDAGTSAGDVAPSDASAADPATDGASAK